MEIIRCKEEMKKRIEKELQREIKRFEAWGKVQRLKKKDGSDFSIFSKNFSNEKTRIKYFKDISCQPFIEVWFDSPSGYDSDDISLYVVLQPHSTYDEEWRKKAVKYSAYALPVYQLTIDECFNAIEKRQKQIEANIVKIQNELTSLDELYAEYEAAVQPLIEFAAKLEANNSCFNYDFKSKIKYDLTIW